MPSEPRDGRDSLWGGLLSVAFAVLYLSFLSRSYVFEGLARAMPIEIGRFDGLFNGNYLLYGFVGWCFHWLMRALGSQELAVVSLQRMDALIGAGGLFLILRSLRALGAERLAAAAWTSVLGLSLGYWSWSVDAQNYIFSTFLLAANFLALAERMRGAKVSPVLLGVLHALAVLGHIVNVLFGAVIACVLFMTSGRHWRRELSQYAAVFFIGVAAAYGLALGLIVRPASLAQAWQWFLGSAAPSGELNLRGPLSLAGLGQWAAMTLNILASREPQVLLSGAKLLLGVSAVAAALSLRRLEGPRRAAAIACAVWLAAYACVFTHWEPYTMVYRISDLIPIMFLLFLGVEAAGFPSAPRLAAPLLLALLLGAGNFAAEIHPRSMRRNNALLRRMDFLRGHTAEGAWISGTGGGEELYIPYFAQRRPLVVERYRRNPGELRIAAAALLARGEAVYFTSSVLSDAVWREALRGLRLKPVAKDAEGFELYRAELGRKSASGARRAHGPRR